MRPAVTTSGTTRDVPVVRSGRASYRPVETPPSAYKVQAEPPRDKRA